MPLPTAVNTAEREHSCHCSKWTASTAWRHSRSREPFGGWCLFWLPVIMLCQLLTFWSSTWVHLHLNLAGHSSLRHIPQKNSKPNIPQAPGAQVQLIALAIKPWASDSIYMSICLCHDCPFSCHLLHEHNWKDFTIGAHHRSPQRQAQAGCQQWVHQNVSTKSKIIYNLCLSKRPHHL